MAQDRDIDIVILWVDNNDPKWQQEKAKYEHGKENHGQNEDNTINRYRDWGTLQYLFRGIEKFAPWVRKVHLVTCGHYPHWINRKNPKLHLVKHSDFIDEKYLPTFSSRAIDLNLHKIPDLAEKFIYFNDDMFILKPLKPSMFFKNGLPCDVFSERAISCSGKEKTPYGYTLISDMEFIARYFNRREVLKMNRKKILNIKYGKLFIYNLMMYILPYNYFFGLYMYHLPSGYLKRNFEEVWQVEGDTLEKVVSHKFRNVMDVNQYLFRFWPLVKGDFHPANMDKLGKVIHIVDGTRTFQTIKKQKYALICIVDDCAEEEYDYLRTELINSFEYVFPKKSSFEI